MNHEKPIAYTRKAIEATAEALAENDSVEGPDDKHYVKAFDILRRAKQVPNPKIYAGILETMAGQYDLKKELGADRAMLFKNVCKEIIEGIVAPLEKQGVTFSGDEFENFLHETISEANKRIRKDPRILSAFEGKEALLDKMSAYLMKENALFSLKGKELE